jgi:hypothetical protein
MPDVPICRSAHSQKPAISAVDKLLSTQNPAMSERNDVSGADLSEGNIITGNGDDGQSWTVPDWAPMFIVGRRPIHLPELGRDITRSMT